MCKRMLAVVIAGCGALTALGGVNQPSSGYGVQGRGGPGAWTGPVGGAVTPQPPPPLDAAAKAKIDQLYARLDELTPKAGPYAGYATYTTLGGGAMTLPGVTKEQTETIKQMQEIIAEIVRTWLGSELTAKAEEYQTRNQEFIKQYQEVQSDTTLDAAGRMARFAEIRQQQADLTAQYQDALGKQQGVRTEMWQRQARRPALQTLKGLLKATDEEWKALEPRVEEVMRLTNDLRTARTRGVFVGMAFGGPKWQTTKGGTPEGDLIVTLKADQTDPAAVNAKLDALRKARTAEETRKNAELAELAKRLKTAQDALRELLTARQEAVAVVEGLLD
jgi:hypothetical protein